MARNDGIYDYPYRIGRDDEPASTAGRRGVTNHQTKIYYNSDEDVLAVEEIVFPGTANEAIYRQQFYYTNVTNSGVDHVTTINPWTTASGSFA
jgi:hypothetical protein